MSGAVQLIQDIEALGVVLSFNSYKVDLFAPGKDVGLQAVALLNERGRCGGLYQQVVDLIQTRAAFAWNVPPDPCEGEACNRFYRIAELRAVAVADGLCLYSTGQTIIPLPASPYEAHRIESAAYCSQLVGEVKPYLMEHAEHFPQMTTVTARQTLERLQKDWPGFEVNGLHGLTMPDQWPVEFRDSVQSAYTISLEEKP